MTLKTSLKDIAPKSVPELRKFMPSALGHIPHPPGGTLYFYTFNPAGDHSAVVGQFIRGPIKIGVAASALCRLGLAAVPCCSCITMTAD